MQEAKIGHFELHGDHPEIVAAFVESVQPDNIYGSLPGWEYTSTLSGLEYHHKGFIFADRYDVPTMESKCTHYIYRCSYDTYLCQDPGEVDGEQHFIEHHYQPMKQAFGDVYPRKLYEVFE